MRAVLARLLPSRMRTPTVDPFATLALQQRLARLAAELRALDAADRLRMGGWHRVSSLQEAYERTLDDACRLAGVEVDEGRGVSHRLLAEAALEARGWRW
mgnify:CR=1 FL=1|jgi:hypothetical protein